MIRTLIMVAVVGFVLCIGALATAVAFAGGASGIGSMLQALSLNKALHWGPDKALSWTYSSDGRHHSTGENGPVVSRDFPWSSEESLEIYDIADITYVQGPVAKLTLEAPAAVLDHIRVENGRIEREGGHDWHGTLKVTLTAPHVHKFNLGGVPALRISQFNQDDLDITLDGMGMVSGTGRAKNLKLDISGTGSVDLADMQIDAAKVELAGTGKAKIGPVTSADIDVTGLGEVELTRMPASLRSDVSGLGRIIQPH